MEAPQALVKPGMLARFSKDSPRCRSVHGKVLLDAAFAVQGAGHCPARCHCAKIPEHLAIRCCQCPVHHASLQSLLELDSPLDMNLDVRALS